MARSDRPQSRPHTTTGRAGGVCLSFAPGRPRVVRTWTTRPSPDASARSRQGRPRGKRVEAPRPSRRCDMTQAPGFRGMSCPISRLRRRMLVPDARCRRPALRPAGPDRSNAAPARSGIARPRTRRHATLRSLPLSRSIMRARSRPGIPPRTLPAVPDALRPGHATSLAPGPAATTSTITPPGATASPVTDIFAGPRTPRLAPAPAFCLGRQDRPGRAWPPARPPLPPRTHSRQRMRRWPDPRSDSPFRAGMATPALGDVVPAPALSGHASPDAHARIVTFQGPSRGSTAPGPRHRPRRQPSAPDAPPFADEGFRGARARPRSARRAARRSASAAPPRAPAPRIHDPSPATAAQGPSPALRSADPRVPKRPLTFGVPFC
jgi:hypothetical protein